MTTLSLRDPGFVGGLSGGVADPYFANVALLLHGNGANASTTIIDNSPVPKGVVAVGNAQISTAVSRFGGSSIALDGSGDYLTVASLDFIFNYNDYTIECWINTSSSADDGIFQISNSVGGLRQTYDSGPIMAISYGRLVFGMNQVTNTATAINDSTWHHVAMVRRSGLLTLFVDGAAIASIANLTNCTGQYLAIGGYYNANYTLYGCIGEFRITKGVARYATSFLPPVAPFPDF
jgi:hypothetical protein